MTENVSAPESPQTPGPRHTPPEGPAGRSGSVTAAPGAGPAAGPQAAPLVLLAATLDGQVLAGWRMNACSPRGLVVQVAETTACPEARAIGEDVAGLAQLDPDRWTVVSLDEVGMAADELADGAREAVRRSDAVSLEVALAAAGGFPGPGGWQGASGPMPLSGAATAAEGARAAALDLNGRIRRGDGEWLDGPDVVEELGEWLREHGIDDRGPAEAEAGGPLDLTPPPRAAQLSDFVFIHMDPEHAAGLDLTHATCRLALGTLECQDDLGSLAEAAIRHLGICPGPGSPDDEDGRWTGFDGAFTQLAAGPAWAPGISDKDVIVRLMGDAQDGGGPASYEDMALIECRKGRWRVTWRDRPLQGRLPADVAVQALHAQRHQLPPDVLRSLAEVWVCGSAARYGAPDETWWWDPELFRAHDVASCEAEGQPDPDGPACAGCGCTDLYGCPEGCSWAAPGLCSSCLLDLARELAGNSGLDGAAGALAAGRPSPPGHDTAAAPFYDQAKWTARWALDVQARLTSLPGVIFHGVPDGPAACRVRVELPGYLFLGELANPGRGYTRSPAGFAVSGDGAAALAHALLTAALGLDAACPACAGTGLVTCEDGVRERPYRDGDLMPTARACRDCGGFGIGVPPAACDAFTEQVILLLPPAAEWTLNRHDVLAWLTRASGDEALAALAQRQAALTAAGTDWAAWLAGDTTGERP